MNTHLRYFTFGLAALAASIFIVSPIPATADPVHETFWHFRQPPKNPAAAVMLGPDGTYWGTTVNGGSHGMGTIYKFKEDGSDFQTVISFSDDGPNDRGAEPSSALVSDGAGFLWGTTERGGDFNAGTVFKVEIEPSFPPPCRELQPMQYATNAGLAAPTVLSTNIKTPIRFQQKGARSAKR